MVARSSRVLTLVALFVIAPIGAPVVMSVLLLFGVTPHLVFLPGFAVRSKLAALGVRAQNAVGVLVTVAVWWAIIMIVWVIVRRFVRRPA
jgi:predicted cobalt transporter CbtA